MMWTLGVEIELLAPRGRSRRDLAEAIAAREGGRVEPMFHLDSEPSKVPGKPIFHNLGPAFRTVGPRGWLARVTDDLTLQDDLDRAARPVPGWHRIVSDDPRLLRLIARHADPGAPLDAVLDPIAALFGTRVEAAPGDLRRVSDLG
ncbi:MAG TPA: amidoligase family protein, partial [Myxococcota bacterium]|nr:amidoligase family protein [Myxococcota bacterium]